MLAGTNGATVENNTITNNGGGGVFVNDNGPVDPDVPGTGSGTSDSCDR